MKVKQSMHTSTAEYDKFDNKRKRTTANSFFFSSLLEVSQEHFLSRSSNQNKPKGNTTACSYTQLFSAGKKTQKHHETPFCTTFTVAHLTLLALGIKNYSVLQEQLDRYTVYLSPINPTGGLNCKKHMRCREEHDLPC